jgi:carboxyl-terminal processing protease
LNSALLKRSCYCILFGGFFLALPFVAYPAPPPDAFTGGAIPAGRLDEWMRDAQGDAFPLLAKKGREAKQFRLIVKEIETYRKRNLEAAGIAEIFATFFNSLQKHFSNEPPPDNTGIARQANALTGLAVSANRDHLVWTFRGKTEEVSLHRDLARVAEESVRRSARLLADRDGISAPVFWYLWVESCLETLGSPFNNYTYADDLALSEAMRLGRTFGPGFIPEVAGDSLVAREVFDPVLRQSGLIEGCALTAFNGESLSAETGPLFDKWLQKTKFAYRVSFKSGGSTKTVEAEAVPYRHPTMTLARLRDIAYIRLSRFSKSSLIEMRRVFRSLSRTPPKGLVIDLRGNPGGAVNFGLVDCFFKPGQKIGTFREMPDGEFHEVKATFEYYDYPAVLIVDGNSASMSEAFAAAFQENKRGKIVGEKTFGKGVGQSCRIIGEEGELCLVTTTYFYPGTERTWNGEGISPDISVESTKEERERVEGFLSRTVPDLNSQVQEDPALATAILVLGGNEK